MRVFVINKRMQPLMMCKPQKARRLLKEGKAKVLALEPFTIQLTIPTGEAVQDIIVGFDPGYKTIGISTVIAGEEVFSMELTLRQNMVDLNSERRTNRRARRHRKTWYRKPRFLNRGKSDGWLAPSILHKKDSHIKIIKMLLNLAPITKVIAEAAAFDIQKIKDPEIEGVGYQQGEQTDFRNVREYVLHRDGHKCQQRKEKSKDEILQVHHIESRKTCGNRPVNLITLCSTCHKNIHNGTKLKAKPYKGFRAETFMTMVRWKIINEPRDLDIEVAHTYEHITKSKRIELGLKKSHCNDTFVIAGGTGEKRAKRTYIVKQVRKQNRKLFKGIRSHVRNTGPRLINGFQRFDKVFFNGVKCFIFGRRKSGYFDLRKLDGQVIHRSASSKKLKLVQSFNTLLWEISANKAFVSSPD